MNTGKRKRKTKKYEHRKKEKLEENEHRKEKKEKGEPEGAKPLIAFQKTRE